MAKRLLSENEMIEEARGLLEPGEERDNFEYLRALCELVARCFPGEDTPTEAERVARKLGTTLCNPPTTSTGR